MSYLKIACAAVLVSSMAVANVAMAGNGGVSGSAPGKTATTPGGGDLLPIKKILAGLTTASMLTVVSMAVMVCRHR